MKSVLVSGLVNTETTVRVRKFPIDYYPIDYPFFGVNTAASGVAYNIALALGTLGDRVTLASMTGTDFPAAYIKQELEAVGLSTVHLKPNLGQTPSSVVLYDGEGKRQVYCDLKDIQETAYGFDGQICGDADLVVACNINFNRPLLHLAKAAGKPIATDVHVLSRIDDDFNREFMQCADILFLSDEGIGWDYRGFLVELARTYGNRILVLGRGDKGAALYLPEEHRIYELPAVQVGQVVNTVGAGDALFSAFIHHFAEGCAPVEALLRAELFASAKIRVSGAAKGFVTAGELETLHRQHASTIQAGMREYTV
ncbi:MAG: carbohydrate kinase family protein [Faecousia sp.]